MNCPYPDCDNIGIEAGSLVCEACSRPVLPCDCSPQVLNRALSAFCRHCGRAVDETNEWPQYKGGTAHTAYQPIDTPFSGGYPDYRVKWLTDLRAPIHAPVALYRGVVFVCSENGRVILLNQENGRILAEISTGSRGLVYAPCVQGGDLWVCGLRSLIHLNAGAILDGRISSGSGAEILGCFELSGGRIFNTHPVLVSDSEHRKLVATIYDGARGQSDIAVFDSSELSASEYEFAVDGEAYAPVAVDGRLLVATSTGATAVFDLDAKAPVWNRDEVPYGDDPAHINDRTLLFDRNHQALFGAFHGRSPVELVLGLKMSTAHAFATNGKHIVFSTAVGLHRFSISGSHDFSPSGSSVATHAISSHPVMTDSVFAGGTNHGSVVIYNSTSPAYYQEITIEHGESVLSGPATSGGRIFVSTANGKTACLAPS